MSFLSKLKDIAVGLERRNKGVFGYPIEKQKRYLQHFNEPHDDIERSYFQYRCQMKLNKPIVSFMLNIASFPMIFLYLRKESTRCELETKLDAAFFPDGKPDNIIPKVLKDSYDKWVTIETKREYLTSEDKVYFKKLWRKYPFSWHFQLKCLLKIRFYSFVIHKYTPKAIVVCNEYSFTSSMLTDYCQGKNIKHINVMHGEKLYYMRDSFFHFHECYVWDACYSDLFKQLRAAPGQFIVAIPDSLQFEQRERIPKYIDYTYYFGSEIGEKATRILEILLQLANRGYIVAVRPHPRYSNIEEIGKQSRNKIEVEDCKSITIENSVLRTRNAISGYSTVLNQAYHNGTKIVIDDMTDFNMYKKLEELKYVMLQKEHKLLSEVMGGSDEN